MVSQDKSDPRTSLIQLGHCSCLCPITPQLTWFVHLSSAHLDSTCVASPVTDSNILSSSVVISCWQARIARVISEANGGRAVVTRMSTAVLGDEITPLAANAPVSSDGDIFSWHIDADPMLLPPSPWTDVYGLAPNRAPGRPRFVTALICRTSPRLDFHTSRTKFLTPLLCSPHRPLLRLRSERTVG